MSKNHHKVEGSSSISHVDYHDDIGTLELGFTSGHSYHYPDCDKAHYHAIKSADSPGQYFHKHLRSMKAEKQ